MGGVLRSLGQPAKALGYYEKALAMYRRLYPEARFKDGHPLLATSLNSLGSVLEAMGEPAKALGYYEKALAMRQKLYPEARFKDGHPSLAGSLNNIGYVLHSMGQPAKALGYYEKALAMCRRLYPEARFKDGHPLLAGSLNNMGFVLEAMGEQAKALGYHEKALAMYQKQVDREIAAAPEAQALAFLRSLPRTRDGYLSVAATLPRTAATSYDPVWTSRAALLRLLLRRHESARVIRLKSEEARHTWQQLGDVRRQVSRLLIEPGKDPVARDRHLEKLEKDQDKLERRMMKLVPELEEQKQLAKLGPKDLAGKLPPLSAFIDFVQYAHYDKLKFNGWRYLAFVLSAGPTIQRIELGGADAIDRAIASWRRGIDNRESSSAPALLRKLLWRPIEEKLPATTTTLYLCPAAKLAKLPFAALPGRREGSVLLEDYALAVVPAGAWLAQKLSKPVNEKDKLLLALGEVSFGTAPSRRKGYAPLPETGRELRRVLEAFAARPDAALRGEGATARALLDRLPGARVAHLATHAYYDEKALQEEYERERKARETWTFQERGSERAGLGARNPLGFVGLALAGANDPSKAVGSGIVTGLDILELPLEKLHLCVLSACETGVGQWNEFAGVAGLQRAFHVAGCRNVVGSLWNVNDAATAALMTQFYHELRVNKRTPLAALREAQLTIYRHPERIADLAGERGRPALEKAVRLGTARTRPAAARGKTADTKLWAAFVLSGPGD
jgi:CHAT domain-containing protein/Tfp pilus assembly protein PilF